MSSTIFQFDSSNKLTRMSQGKPASESEIQSLIGDYPEVLGENDSPLLLIKREAPISDRSGANGRWSLDHLFVSREGIPILVEVKQASNTQLRREVVGQLVEYAANASYYWNAERLGAAFESNYSNADAADEALDLFLSDPEDSHDHAVFWDTVEANLSIGRFRMVIVADLIPRELARLVEFLNEQMKATVLAIELSWFVSEAGMKALVPRIIGQSERTMERKEGSGPREPHPLWSYLKANHPEIIEFNLWKSSAQDLFRLLTGDPRIVIGTKFTGSELWVYTYFDGANATAAYQFFRDDAEAIEARYPFEITWDEMTGYQASRIVDKRPATSIDDPELWSDLSEWLSERAKAMREAVLPTLNEFKNSEN